MSVFLPNGLLASISGLVQRNEAMLFLVTNPPVAVFNVCKELKHVLYIVTTFRQIILFNVPSFVSFQIIASERLDLLSVSLQIKRNIMMTQSMKWRTS